MPVQPHILSNPKHPAAQLNHLESILREKEARISLGGLRGSSAAYVLSRLQRRLRRPFLVVAAEVEGAEEFRREWDFFSGRDGSILYFPPWDSAPYEQSSPVPEVTARRLDTLFRLMSGSCRGVVTTYSAFAQKVLAPRVLGELSHYLVSGEEVEREALLRTLLNLGYSSVPLVEDRGTFSVRGGILDIFPPSQPLPVRIDFFGDEVESIRSFDPLSQRSLEPLEELVILPSRELVISEKSLEEFAPRLKERCDDLDIAAGPRRHLLDQLRASIYPHGIEYLQPLFHPGLVTLSDYTGADAVKVLLDPGAVEEASERLHQEVEAGEAHCREHGIIACVPSDLFLERGQALEALRSGRSASVVELELAGEQVVRFDAEHNGDLRVDVSRESEHLLKPVSDRLRGLLEQGWRVALVSHQRGQAERLLELFHRYPVPLALREGAFGDLPDDPPAVHVLVGDISRGFRLQDERLAVIAEEEIFGRRTRRRGVSELRKKQILSSLADLKPGNCIVHVDHGIGLYRGLEHLRLGEGMEGDFLLLEYAGGDRLYLPVDRIDLVQRYVGADGAEPQLDKLGGTGWERTKTKARKAVEEMAEELLKIYAERQVREGYAFSRGDEALHEFEASFAYEETPDQLAAIEDVLNDMESRRPMDRLVCGDVGYGKTEVAMRAAFKAVMDGKQVAVLVPTTVLAQQHLETFRARFRDYPVNIDMLSRFRSAKEQQDILAKVKKGEMDIVIGTHRLLQKDVEFKDLGLLVVDEEQRFGVAHKERLKKFRAVVDIITLTATPIPRTLHMSLMGIRDLSIIDTPPVDRLAVKTYISRFSDEVVREAVMRELRRG
ncbi:MAG TPA: DEAD/DEAH box helicase, partial [Verrucomicrobiae bacterium]|nr:DEAD/DEAH box helicase [Verrucomicrobiae bacterium]